MDNWIDLTNYGIAVAGLMVVLMGLIMSIYSLCNQDPKRARQVIMDFTTYLRRNFTAIASEAPVPFSTELEHTRAYLAVEQAQYENSLFVDYDTPHTTFRIPPLTLQPIVENAVKHGSKAYLISPSILSKKFDILEHPLEGRLENR